MYITQLQQYNQLLDKKYGRIGKYYQPKAYKLANKLLQWKQVSDKQSFVQSYEDQYKLLTGVN